MKIPGVVRGAYVGLWSLGGPMKAPLVILALLALAVAPAPAAATPCVIVNPNDIPPVFVGECTTQQAAPGKIVIFATNDLCISVEPLGSVPPVEVYECQDGGTILP